MKSAIAFKKAVAHPLFSLICVLLLCLVLPKYGIVSVMVGSASVLSAYVAGMPDNFRSRNGSLRPAVCLVAAMWLAAGVVAMLSATGGI